MPDCKRHAHRTVRELQTLRRTDAPRPARALLPLLVAMCFAPVPAAHALELGAIEPRSSIGEPFAARVPLQLAAGEEISLQCIRVLPHPDAAQGMPLPPKLRLDIETIGNNKWLAIRTPAFFTGPVAGLRIKADCNKPLAENFVVLVDPVPQVDAPSAAGQQFAPDAPAVQVNPAASRRPLAAARRAKPRKDAATSKSVPQVDATRSAIPTVKAATEGRGDPPQAASLPAAQTGNNASGERELFERIQRIEESLAAMRSALEQHQTAPAPVPAPVPEPVAPEAASEMPWIIGGGTLAALGLAGSLLWWRRRKNAAALAPETAAPFQTTPARLAPVIAAGYTYATASAAPVAAPRPGTAATLVLPPMTPLMPAAPPAHAALSTAAPARVRAESMPPSTQAPRAAIVFSPPGEDNARAAQEAYFAGRFGAHAEDVKMLQDTDTVIEQARSIYQDDGDALRAADLLELTVALQPEQPRLWLALFAIYRRETMVRQYALLARKFGARFALDPAWPLVQQLGREIDADNALYGSPAAATDVNRDAADDAAQQDVTDEWLGVQLDFNSSLLAAELREQLISDAAADAPPIAANAG